MVGHRFRQNLVLAVVLLGMVALSRGSSIPQVAGVREYVHFAVHTDMDMGVVREKARAVSELFHRMRNGLPALLAATRF